MRIVGGIYRGRKIEIRNFGSRPTTDFAREALFNILSNHFDFYNLSFLDLFSGTGSISFEMASRGCTDIDLVETDSKSISFINKTISELSIKGVHTVKMDVFRFIPLCKKKYDIIFADPPYDLKNLNELPDLVLGHEILKATGWFILEHGKDHSFAGNRWLFDERRYGGVHFSFFRK